MKIIHIADIHIGATPDAGYKWSRERSIEIIERVKAIIHICNQQKIDLLLIAGDLFHRQPLVRELKEVNYMFEQLVTTKVVLMAGNHDFIGLRSNYIGFTWCDQVTMLSSESLASVYLKEMNAQVYGFSYHQRDILEPRYDQVTPVHRDRINILLAHGGDERNIPINKNKLKALGFDYIALGHIHKPEIISENIAYSGSLEPLNKNEVGQRGYMYVQVDKESCEIQFIPCSTREYYHIEIVSRVKSTNESLLEEAKVQIKQKGRQHIYKIILTGIKDDVVQLDLTRFYELGNVIEVVDKTMPDYDFNELYESNQDNIIGMYIDEICNANETDETIQKALYYGIEALLGVKE